MRMNGKITENFNDHPFCMEKRMVRLSLCALSYFKNEISQRKYYFIPGVYLEANWIELTYV